jgi:hypothetical protein
MKVIKARCTFAEELLGSASPIKEIHGEFVASKAPDAPSMEEEIEAIGVDEVTDKGTSIFSRLPDGSPILWDYQLKGFFKDTCSALARIKPDKKDFDPADFPYISYKLTAHRKVIDKLIFPGPRKILLHPSGEMTTCQRPLRAQTPKGERTALASSEALPIGTWFDVDIRLLDARLEPYVIEWLNYGEFSGLGQWRNSGKGRFLWKQRQ